MKPATPAVEASLTIRKEELFTLRKTGTFHFALTLFLAILISTSQVGARGSLQPLKWWNIPFACITQKWQSVTEKIKQSPLLSWGLGGTIFAIATVVAFKYLRASKPKNATDKQTYNNTNNTIVPPANIPTQSNNLDKLVEQIQQPIDNQQKPIPQTPVILPQNTNPSQQIEEQIEEKKIEQKKPAVDLIPAGCKIENQDDENDETLFKTLLENREKEAYKTLTKFVEELKKDSFEKEWELKFEKKNNCVYVVKKQKQSNKKKKCTTVEITVPLVLVTDRGINLFPKPDNLEAQKTWFWNNGKTEYDVHTVTYKKTDYISTFNGQYWEQDHESGMPYITYLLYLIDHNKPTDKFIKFIVKNIDFGYQLKQPEPMVAPSNSQKPFIYCQSIVHLAHMLNKSTEYLPEYKKLKENNGDLAPFVKKLLSEAAVAGNIPGCWKLEDDQEKKILQVLTSAILEEEKHPDCAVFYTGYTGSIKFVYDFITALHNCLEFNPIYRERSMFERNKKLPENQNHLVTFLQKNETLFKTDDAPDWKVASDITSANLYLCAYPDNQGENTIKFFIKNNSMSTDWISQYIDTICENVGIDKFSNNDIKEWLEKYQELGGRLKQTFIPRALCNEVTYLARQFGIPAGMMKNSLAISEPLKNIKAEKIEEYLTIIRNSPDTISYKELDGLQARILTSSPIFSDPVLLRSKGIRTIEYMLKDATTKRTELRASLKKELSTRILTAIEKKELKNDPSTQKPLPVAGKPMLTVTAKAFYTHCTTSRKTPIKTATIWEKQTFFNAQNKKEYFINDCKKIDIKTPKKRIGTTRIATYNVHAWDDPDDENAFTNICNNIQEIAPDILMLEECATNPGCKIASTIWEHFKKLGYPYHAFITTIPTNIRGKPFGNAILSKYPMEASPTLYKNKSTEDRGYIKAKIVLPNKKEVNLFATHLEVHNDQTRVKQVEELMENIDKNLENVIIGGDFNAVQKEDYLKKVGEKMLWDVISADYKNYSNQDTIPTDVHQKLKDKGFIDCFTYKQAKKPVFTTWNGTIVDFICIKKDSWKLPIDGCYTHYSSASDHLPVIIDIKQ